MHRPAYASKCEGGWLSRKPVRTSGNVTMKDFKLGPGLSTTWIVVTMAMVLFGSRPLQAQTPGAAAAHIQTYYQELMPTIRQAGRLSVRERDRRFGPAITAAFDLATMTRLRWALPGKASRWHSRRQSRMPLHDSSWQIMRAR